MALLFFDVEKLLFLLSIGVCGVIFAVVSFLCFWLFYCNISLLFPKAEMLLFCGCGVFCERSLVVALFMCFFCLCCDMTLLFQKAEKLRLFVDLLVSC